MFWILVLCSSNVVWLLHILKKYYAWYDLCDSGVHSKEMINFFFFICQVSWLVKKTSTMGFTQTDTIYVINVKLCMHDGTSFSFTCSYHFQ